MSFMDKMKDLVGIGDEYDDEMEVSQEEIDAYKREISREESASAPAPAPAAAPARTSFSDIERPMPKTPIAAMADSHFLISKRVQEGSTVSGIDILDEEESIRELARMVGADEVDASAAEHARNMRVQAMQVKAKF